MYNVASTTKLSFALRPLCFVARTHRLRASRFFDVNINRAVDTIASEMLELLPSVLSRREIGEPDHDVRPSPVVTAAVGTDPGVGGGAVQLTARVFEEEEPARHGMEWSSGPWFCARLVVVNSAASPLLARVTIAGLPAFITNASRLFTSAYSRNLTRTQSGDAVLADMIDGSSANVYQMVS